jgi:hypothetical protein
MSHARRLLVLTFATVALVASVPASATIPAAPYAQRLTLRLSDLGPGYVWPDGFCYGSVLAGEGMPWAVTRIYLRHRHLGCTAELMEAWAPAGTAPRPDAITSAAWVFRDAVGPDLLLQHARDVIAYATTDLWALTPLTPPAIGDEAVAFQGRATTVRASTHPSGAVVVWRSGRVLALVSAAGADTNVVAEATRLANVQQQRIEHPTPLLPTDNDDVEVRLDDPDLDTPVLWLGHDFLPGDRLPALTLALADVDDTPSVLGDLRLEYGRAKPPFVGVSLYVWRRSRWRNAAKTSFARLGWHERCVRSTRIPVEGGIAVIYAGHERRQARCGRRPDRFFAHVFLRDVMVSVDPIICTRCRKWGGSYEDPYDSMAGMRAVVRGLHLREPRTYATP